MAKNVKFTNSLALYNTEVGMLKFLLADNRISMSIANVNEEYIGKEPEKGAKMYDYDSAIKFGLSYTDVLTFSKNLKKVLDGEMDSFALVHKTTNDDGNNTKILNIGRGRTILGEDANGFEDNIVLNLVHTKENDEEFDNYYVCKTTETYPNMFIIDNEDIENAEPNIEHLEAEAILKFLDMSWFVLFNISEHCGGTYTNSGSNKEEKKATVSRFNRRRNKRNVDKKIDAKDANKIIDDDDEDDFEA